MKTFILGYETEELDLIPQNLTEYKTTREADASSEEWCVVIAETLELAKMNYEEQFLEHKNAGRITGPFANLS